MKTTYGYVCIGAAILTWLLFVTDPNYFAGEDSYLYQPTIVFVGTIILTIATYIASKVPEDIIEEMFSGLIDTPITIAYITAGFWVVGGIILAGSRMLGNWVADAHPLLVVAVMLILVPPGFIIHWIVALTFPALLGAAIAAIVPLCYMSIIVMTATTETLETAKQHTKSKLPSAEIERLLAEAMKRDMDFDDAIIVAIHDLPFLSRIKHTYMYKVKAKKYREMWEVINAQTEMMRAQSGTARAAHEYERAKRGDH